MEIEPAKLEIVTCDTCGSAGREILYEFGTKLKPLDIVICKQCGLVYLTPRPRQEYLSSFYPNQYYSFQPSSSPTRLQIFHNRLKNSALNAGLGYTALKSNECLKVPPKLGRWLASRVSVPPFIENGKLLDIGCGTGQRLLQFCSLGWKVAGVEISERAASLGRQQGLEIFSGQVEDAPWDDETFNAITLYHVLEHVPSPKVSLAQVHRLLVPGGVVVIVSPNFNSWERKLFRQHWDYLDVPIHFYHFTRASLEAALNEKGFVIERVFFSSARSSAYSFLRWWPWKYRPQFLFSMARLVFLPFGFVADVFLMGANITVFARKPALGSPLTR